MATTGSTPTAGVSITSGDSVEDMVRNYLKNSATSHTTEEAKPATPEVVTPLLTKPAKKAAGPGQVMASKIIGCRTWDGDFPVTILDKSLMDKRIAFHIPDPDPGYVLHKSTSVLLLQALERGDKTLLTGPRGAGKSSVIKELCARTNRPFIRINMTRDMESAAFFGSLTVEGGATVWEDGPITEAVRYGGVGLVDEWDVTPPGIMFGLQWLLEDGGKLFLKEMPGSSEEKTITPHEDFRLVFAGNTLGLGDMTGEYAGTQVQNTATLDRFQTTVVVDYLSPSEEAALIKARVPEATPRLVEGIVKVANMIRSANTTGECQLTMSPRTAINWTRKCVALGSIKDALVVAFGNKLPSEEKKVVQEFCFKVFGKELI